MQQRRPTACTAGVSSSWQDSRSRKEQLLLLLLLVAGCCFCCQAEETATQTSTAARAAGVPATAVSGAGPAARTAAAKAAGAAGAPATAAPRPTEAAAGPGAAAAAAAEDGCAGSACPYDLDTTPDLQSLLRRHQKYQVATLMGSSPAAPTRAPVVLVNSNHLVGLGNRVPAVVTGFVLALFTKRLFMLQSTFQQFVELPFPGNWKDLKSQVQGTNCNVPWMRLADPTLGFCEDLYEGKTGSRTADIMRFTSPDYDLPPSKPCV